MLHVLENHGLVLGINRYHLFDFTCNVDMNCAIEGIITPLLHTKQTFYMKYEHTCSFQSLTSLTNITRSFPPFKSIKESSIKL